MADIRTIDARGYSCPQPVIFTEKALKQQQNGTVEVLVDSGTARENVTRFAAKAGWVVKLENQIDGSYKLVLTK
jgi:tRNA 2-thiouridine synthesizing protein A